MVDGVSMLLRSRMVCQSCCWSNAGPCAQRRGPASGGKQSYCRQPSKQTVMHRLASREGSAGQDSAFRCKLDGSMRRRLAVLAGTLTGRGIDEA